MHTKFWLENLNRKGKMSDLDIDGRIILKWILEKYGLKMETEFKQIRTGSNGKFL
jgi:hypothetical protein